MDNKSVLLHFWKLASDDEGWYPPYKDALNGVSAELSEWRAEGKASNTIRETVAHITYFKERLLRRLKGLEDLNLGSNDNSFIVHGNAAENWNEEMKRLFDVHAELSAELQKLSEADVDKLLKNEPIGAQFMHLIVHDAYHTGQIIFIRKLKGEWPSNRTFL